MYGSEKLIKFFEDMNLENFIKYERSNFKADYLSFYFILFIFCNVAP